MGGKFLIRGMLTGLIAGIIAFGFATFFGEPQIESSIAFEETIPHSHASLGHEEVTVSRTLQSTAGLLAGLVVYTVSLGGIFSLVFAFSIGRVGNVGPRGLAASLALMTFLVIFLIPSLKYPANPPSVGLESTLSSRTELFFLMIVVSIAAATVAFNTVLKIKARIGLWNATIAGLVCYGIIVGSASFLFPAVDEVPKDFSAALLWDFRIASVGLQIVIWTSLGILFGWSAERLLRRSEFNNFST